MKPSFIMASHGRLPIVLQNLEHLLTIGSIYLALTDKNEYDQIKRAFPEVNLVITANSPLGAKWQKAVDLARFHDSETVIICGSDDVLSTDFVTSAQRLIEDQDIQFVGVNGWWITDNKNHYKCSYRFYKNFPAGSGRVFTKKCLDAIDWKLFDKAAHKHLDDRAIDELYRRGIKHYISQDGEYDGLKVLALKGNWGMLNPLSKFLSAPTIICDKIETLPKEFPTFNF
jgi:hypothetical protein